MKVNTGHDFGNIYLSKVMPAAIYLSEQLLELETDSKSLTYENCMFPDDSGRSRLKCSDELGDLTTETVGLLGDIGWTIHRLLVLMYRKHKSQLTKEVLDELESKLIYEYGPTTCDGEGIKEIKQLPLPIGKDYLSSVSRRNAMDYQFGDEVWYQCPRCGTQYEDVQDMSYCVCKYDDMWKNGKRTPSGWDASEEDKNIKPDKPTKYDERAHKLISAVEVIKGGE